MDEIIKKSLEEEFKTKFIVENVINEVGKTYYIRLKDLEKNGFIGRLIVKDDIRLIIEAEPDEYGITFLNNICNSNAEQRKNFISYWKQLNDRDINVEINNKVLSKDEFITLNNDWKKFIIKFNKAPYCSEYEENKEKVVLTYLIIIYKMIFSILTYDINDKTNLEGYVEGNKYSIISTKYERNPKNREACLQVKGYKCSVCGFDFEEKYGEIGKNYIEVHHATQVSDMGSNYLVDPIKDLYPLCSNCHSMIHRKNPPYSIEELKNIIKK